MHRAYLLFWLIPVVGLALIGRAFYLKVTPLSSGQLGEIAPTPEIQGSARVGQTFKADYPGLFAIGLRFVTFNRTNTEEVVFHLTEWPDTQKEMATVRFNARDLPDPELYRVSFPPPLDSQGKLYFFSVESPSSRPGNAVSLALSRDNAYTGGAAYLGERAIENDLKFVAYYQPSPWQVAGLMLERMAENKPWIWGQPAFYVVLFALYLLLAGAFFWQVLRLAMAGPPGAPQDGGEENDGGE